MSVTKRQREQKKRDRQQLKSEKKIARVGTSSGPEISDEVVRESPIDPDEFPN